MRYDPKRMSKKQRKTQDLADQHRDRVLAAFKKKQEKLAKETVKLNGQADNAKSKPKQPRAVSKLDKQTKKIKKDNHRLKTKLKQRQDEYRKQVAKLRRYKKKVDEANAESAALQAKLTEVQGQLAAARQYTRELSEERDYLERDNQAQSKRIKSLTNMNRRTNQRYQELFHSTEGQELFSLRRENLSLTRSREDLKKEIKPLQQKLHAAKKPPKATEVIGQLSINQLIDELFSRLAESNTMKFLPILPLYNRVNYLLQQNMRQTEKHRANRAALHNLQQLYGYVKNIDDQLAFVSLDGSVFPNPQVKNNQFPLVEDDVYRGNYLMATDQFMIDKHYPALSADYTTQLTRQRKAQRPQSASKDAFLNQFILAHPDAKQILGSKDIKIVTWFKQISYKRLFQPFDTVLEILDPSERSGDYIYNRIENVDTDLAFILIEGSHHVNSRIYKDRPAAHPEKIRILNNASPKELLQMTYDHFKSLATRQHSH